MKATVTAREFVAGRSATRVGFGHSYEGKCEPSYRDHENPSFICPLHDHVVNLVTTIVDLWVASRETSNPGPLLIPRIHIDVSSDEKPLIRSNMGRDVIARTEVSDACSAESHIHSTVRERTGMFCWMIGKCWRPRNPQRQSF